MPWVLFDVAVVLAALVVLGLVAYRVFLRAKELMKAAGQTTSLLGEASDRLAGLQTARPGQEHPAAPRR